MFRRKDDRSEQKARRERPSLGFLLALALFWSLIIGVPCGLLVDGAVRQVASACWPATEGVITVSEPGRDQGHGWKLEYVYAVADKEHVGTQYAHNPITMLGGHIDRYAGAYPVDASVVVYYDPDNPADAVLSPGFRGATLWMAMFLTPFLLMGLALWFGVILGLLWPNWSPPGFHPVDPRQVIATEAGSVVVRPHCHPWPVVFLGFLGLGAFLVTSTMVFVGLVLSYWSIEGFLVDPPIAVPTCVWAALLIGCVLATWWAVRPAPVLTLNTEGKVLEFGPAGSPRVKLPFTAIAGVVVSEQEYHGRNGALTRYAVELVRNDGEAALTVAEYENSRDADALADWLRERVADRTHGRQGG